MQADRPGMTVVYDGGCPFCANYVTLMNLRNAVGAVTLVDARNDAPVVKALAARGYDLNEGMAVLFGDKVYYGEDAVTFISSLTNSRNWLGRLVTGLLRTPSRAALFYPIMKLGRRVTLKALGRPLLDPGGG
jgi:predicted DCC family thiol-disulfide oxidoreductase YuxK